MDLYIPKDLYSCNRITKICIRLYFSYYKISEPLDIKINMAITFISFCVDTCFTFESFTFDLILYS